MQEVIVTAVRVTEGSPDEIVCELVEARTRRLMAELAATPDAWPTRQARRELAALVEESLEEYNLLALGR